MFKAFDTLAQLGVLEDLAGAVAREEAPEWFEAVVNSIFENAEICLRSEESPEEFVRYVVGSGGRQGGPRGPRAPGGPGPVVAPRACRRGSVSLDARRRGLLLDACRGVGVHAEPAAGGRGRGRG